MPSAFWSVAGNLFQRVGTALRNDTVPECFVSCGYCGAVSCTHSMWRERILILSAQAALASSGSQPQAFLTQFSPLNFGS